MIVLDDNKKYAIYCRTNRRVRWEYSEYGGRYETKEEAVENAKKHYNGKSFEYMIEDMETGEVMKGENHGQ